MLSRIQPILRALGILVVNISFTAPIFASGPTRISDREYARPGGTPLFLDACIPAGPGPFPACVIIHGGGWTSGDKRQGVPNLFGPLERAGYAWFSVNYRLGGTVHPYPASIEDSETAFRWIGEHAAEFRIDAARRALIGPSAGGHIVSLLGARGGRDLGVRAVVSFFGVHDMLAYERDHPEPLRKAFGVASLTPAQRDVLEATSPTRYVHGRMPPYLLIHGTDDKLVAYSQSVDFQASMIAAGARCELITMPGRGHGLPRGDMSEAPYAAMIAWLDRQLKP